jgi:hypothetical protein
MKYYMPFADLNKKLYLVRIITEDDDSQTRYLTPSDEPFTTEMSKNENIYAPARYSTAEAGIIQDNAKDLMLDMYSGTATGTKVQLTESPTYDADGKVTDEGTVVWTGFATPVSYDNDYVSPHDETKLECVDGLAVLKYMKYTVIGSYPTNCTFAAIVQHILSRVGCFKSLYVSAATHLSGDAESLFSKLVVSESNFFDKKDDKTESDDDVAWYCQEVLEEICKYLGVTAVAWRDSVYLIDFDAVRAGYTKFWAYDLSDMSVSQEVDLSNSIEVSQETYAETGATVSLDEVYNKIRIKATINDFDDVLPEMFDDDLGTMTNITTTNDRNLDIEATRLYVWIKPSMYTPSWVYGDAVNGNIEIIIDWGKVGKGQGKNYFVAEKFYTSTRYKTYLYNWDTNQYNSTHTCPSVATPASFGWDEAHTYFGCIIKREQVKELSDDVVAAVKNYSTTEDYIKFASKEVSTLDFEDLVMFMTKGDVNNVKWFAGGEVKITGSGFGNPQDFAGGREYDKYYMNFPAFQTTFTDQTAKMFGGKNAYLVISGSFILGLNDDDAYIKPQYQMSSSYKSTVRYYWMYVYCRLKWGNSYWNGSSWQTTETDFKLYFGEEQNQKAKDVVYQPQSIRNTVKWWYGIDEEGTAIDLSTLSQEDILSDDIEFTMYMPMQQYDDAQEASGQGDMRSYYIFLQDFAIKAVIGDPTFSGRTDTDTKYTNVIDPDFASDLDDIEFKINTWDDKKPCYSAVAYKDGDVLKWLDKTVNDAINAGEQLWQGSDSDASGDSGGLMRQEEHMIYRMVTQYQTPATRLEMAIRNYLAPWTLLHEPLIDKYLIVDCQSIDFAKAQSKVDIREHKV